MHIIYLTDISFELLDIFLPIKNCKGIIIIIQQADPRIALHPSFKYNK
jgi:hypothetical protein